MAMQAHKHRPRVTHVICQRAGVPYEVERVHCSECGRLLDERRLKRAEAA